MIHGKQPCKLLGALLLGGALALSTSGCKKPIKVFWPVKSSTPSAETESGESVPQSAVPEERRAGPGVTSDPAPEAFGPDSGTGGYPESSYSGEERPVGYQVEELPNVLFAFDDDQLTADARRKAARAADYLQQNPNLNVVLRGHTDDRGTEEYNIALGSRRAQAVREALIEQGIAASRIETVSFGKSQPLETGRDEATRSRNRRVEFFLYEKP